MVKSMTGYGKHEAVIAAQTCTVEVRSVNGRFLELSVRSPKEWAEHEHLIREVVKGAVNRGSVSLFIRREESEESAVVDLNQELVAQYVAKLRALQAEHSIDGGVRLEHILQMPGIFSGEQSDVDAEQTKTELIEATRNVLSSLDEMRIREGAQMVADLNERLQMITDLLAKVEELSKARIPLERQRLLERVQQLVDEATIDEQRLQLEIILLSEKLDVSEECVRLRSHIKHFRSDLDEGGVVGRKLNFQLQEMNREVNTIGSKVNDAEIGRHVVHMKEELERMREQVQNIE